MSVQEINRAREFAIKHHGDQKYGDQPYVVHLDEVADIIRTVRIGESQHVTALLVVAYLHDVVEDTDATVEMVRDEFDSGTNTGISAAVAAVTDEPGENRKARKRATYMKMRNLGGPYCQIPCLVKLADRLANVRLCVREKKDGLFKMYRKEHEAFRLAVYRDYEDWQPLMDELDGLLD